MKIKLFLAIIFLAALLAVYYYFYFATKTEQSIDLPVALKYQDLVPNKEQSDTSLEPNTSTPKDLVDQPEAIKNIEPIAEESEPVASSINLAVPFTAQAPTANWAQPFQDACEEASLLMVDYYYEDKKLPSKLEVENILTQMVAWQEQNWGAHENLPAQKVSDLALALFNQKLDLVTDLTPEKIRKYLQAGRPVIVPADGKKLANPNFTNGGPDYHMLVIKGYIDGQFITNDPGTRKGADFTYTEDNIMYSIADWDANKKAASGGQVGLVFRPR